MREPLRRRSLKRPHYLLGAITSPGQTMKRLADDPRGVRRAAIAITSVGVLYAVTSAVLAASGAVPLAPEPFNAGADNYFFWQMVFSLPYVLAAWLVSAGVIRLFGRRGRGKKDPWRGAAACAAYGTALPLFVAWLPTAVWTAFTLMGMRQDEWVGILSPPGLWQALYLSTYILAAAWAAVLLAIGSGRSQKIGVAKSAVAGLAAATCLAVTYVAFIR